MEHNFPAVYDDSHNFRTLYEVIKKLCEKVDAHDFSFCLRLIKVKLKYKNKIGTTTFSFSFQEM